jgi:TusA-related sulfurtransferase
MSTFHLDVTKEHCPMTFVKVKLKLEQLGQSDVLEILLNEGEPLDNVPKTAIEQGFQVLETTHVKGAIHKVVIRK